jgi:hypothetical protein
MPAKEKGTGMNGIKIRRFWDEFTQKTVFFVEGPAPSGPRMRAQHLVSKAFPDQRRFSGCLRPGRSRALQPTQDFSRYYCNSGFAYLDAIRDRHLFMTQMRTYEAFLVDGS